MAEVRRPKKSRAARPLPREAARPEDEAAEETDASAGDDESERVIARMFAGGVPLAGLASAFVVGYLAGLAPALLVLAGTALLGTIGFFWASLRTLSGDAPLQAGVASHALVSRVPAPERKRETLRALKDLEFEHSIGKIDDADFKELEARYRSVAKTLMREIDAGLAPRREEAERIVAAYLEKRALRSKPTAEEEPERAKEPGPPSGETASARVECGKCSTSNEPDAAFCKKCGGPLSKVEPAPVGEGSDAAL
jgi:hypothetical protein